MIAALLVFSDSVITGSEELIARWLTDPACTLWIDLSGTTELDNAQQLIKNFKLHPLAVQDLVGECHPARIEAFDDLTFLIGKYSP